VSPDNLFFASGSHDGKVKIWDCQRLERNVTNRSRKTYSGIAGRVTSLAICEGTHSVACGSDAGMIHVFRVDYTPSTQMYTGVAAVRTYDRLESSVVCLESWLQPGAHVILYGLSAGTIGGIDLRGPNDVFRFVNESRYGQLETFVVGPGQNWIVAGTSRGFYIVWDVRFGLPVHSWRQPSKNRVRRLVHKEGDLVVSAAGADDVLVWDVSAATVTQLFRVAPVGVELPELSLLAHANPAPPMEFGAEELRDLQAWSTTALSDERHAPSDVAGGASTTAAAAASPTLLASSGSTPLAASSSAATTDVDGATPQPVRTTALFCTRNFVLAGGSDRCVRFWESKSTPSGGGASPASYTVCGSEQPTIYSSSIVEGCVVQQAISQPPPHTATILPAPISSEKGLVTAARFHRDSILDIQAIESPHNMMLTAGRDGVIKVWK
jgi:phosphoinositide-3-kinase regulatory subunit 4